MKLPEAVYPGGPYQEVFDRYWAAYNQYQPDDMGMGMPRDANEVVEDSGFLLSNAFTDGVPRAMADGKYQRYTIPKGVRDVRAMYSQHLNQRARTPCLQQNQRFKDQQFSTEGTMMVPGGIGALHLVLDTLSKPGESIMISPIPNYFSLLNQASQKNELIEVYNPNFEVKAADLIFAIQEAANRNTSKYPNFVILANPNNPTGKFIDPKELELIITAAAGHNTMVFIDGSCNNYHRLGIDDGVSKALASDNTIYVETFSKDPNLAAFRLGVLTAHPKIIETLSKNVINQYANPNPLLNESLCDWLQRRLPYDPSVPVIYHPHPNPFIAGLESVWDTIGPVRTPEGLHLKRSFENRIHEESIDAHNERGILYAEQTLQSLIYNSGLIKTYIPPEACYYTLVEANVLNPEIGGIEFTEYLAKEKKLDLVPGDIFGLDASKGCWVRMCLARSDSEIRDYFGRMESGIYELNNQYELAQQRSRG